MKGSFTAVLNLTTDKAPTNPRDNASDDLTTATNDATLIVIINKVLPNDMTFDLKHNHLNYEYY